MRMQHGCSRIEIIGRFSGYRLSIGCRVFSDFTGLAHEALDKPRNEQNQKFFRQYSNMWLRASSIMLRYCVKIN